MGLSQNLSKFTDAGISTLTNCNQVEHDNIETEMVTSGVVEVMI